MRFLRLVLDEGAASTAAAWKSRHSLMIQAIHADRKVLVDATPYDPHSTWLKEMGDTWVFFSAERNFRRVQLEWEEKVVKGRDGPAAARLLVQQVGTNWAGRDFRTRGFNGSQNLLKLSVGSNSV